MREGERCYLDVLACAGTHSGIRTVRPDARNESGRLDPEGAWPRLSICRAPPRGMMGLGVARGGFLEWERIRLVGGREG